MAAEAERAARPQALCLVLLGPPGSGKGTQAQILSRRWGIPAISTGDMLRSAVTSGSELGRKVGSIMADGGLVDDHTMAEVVRRRLEHDDAAHGFLLDGYPRTLAQADTLEEMLQRQDRSLDGVVLIRVPEAELIRRTLSRRRLDDSEEVVRRRLRLYEEKTEPLVGYYQQRDLLRVVDGDRAIEAVTDGIEEAVGESA